MERCRKSEREGLIIYGSDHGDHNGEYELYGKQSFLEGSARVPIIIRRHRASPQDS